MLFHCKLNNLIFNLVDSLFYKFFWLIYLFENFFFIIFLRFFNFKITYALIKSLSRRRIIICLLWFFLLISPTNIKKLEHIWFLFTLLIWLISIHNIGRFIEVVVWLISIISVNFFETVFTYIVNWWNWVIFLLKIWFLFIIRLLLTIVLVLVIFLDLLGRRYTSIWT